VEIARAKVRVIYPEMRRPHFADLQTEAEGHKRKNDPTFSASTRNALGQDGALSC
jgi:hypothetical protein